MDALVADAPEVPAQGVVPVLSVGDVLIRTAASIAMVLPAVRAAFPVTIALSVVQNRPAVADLIASIASLHLVGAAVSRGRADTRGKADTKAKAVLKSKGALKTRAVSRAKAVSNPRGVLTRKAVSMVKIVLNAGITPRSAASASAVTASNGLVPGSVRGQIAVVRPVRNAPVQAVMTSGAAPAVADGTETRPVRLLNRISARERS